MAYNYYQSNHPGWGTNQFRFGRPPTPNFQPQPFWGGFDFYRAHAGTSDPSLYDYAWDRVSRGVNNDTGVGVNDARNWHRHVYAGMSDSRNVMPHEIGHAAAYEAFRTWSHNSSMYEPLSGDTERQREGLIGLAIGEAMRLLQQLGRNFDRYGRMAACDSAASTAANLFNQSRSGNYYSQSPSMSPSYSRGRDPYRQDYSPTMSHAPSNYGEMYSYDDPIMFHGKRHRRSRSGHRSRSRSHSRTRVMEVPHQYPGSVPIPGTNVIVPTSYAGSYGSYGSPVQAGYPGSYGSSYGGSGYNGYGNGSHFTNALGTLGQSPPSPMAMYGNQPMYDGYHRPRRNSYVTPMPVQTAYAPQQMIQQPPIIIKTHRKKHRHGHHHRTRSIEPLRIEYPRY